MKSLVAFFALAAVAAPFGFAVPSHAQKPTPVSSSAPILCVVKGETIASAKDAVGKTTYHDKTYYFCCPGCVSAFNKASDAQKAKYAKTTDLRVKQVVLQKQLDAVKAELKQTETAEPAEPMKHTTVVGAKAGLTCAVTGEAIDSPADAAGGKSDYKSKTYYFCCPGCKTKFDAAPAKFAALADKRANAAIIK